MCVFLVPKTFESVIEAVLCEATSWWLSDVLPLLVETSRLGTASVSPLISVKKSIPFI